MLQAIQMVDQRGWAIECFQIPEAIYVSEWETAVSKHVPLTDEGANGDVDAKYAFGY